MDLKQARTRIARTQSKGGAATAQEIERLSLALLDKLPRDGSCMAELAWGYQQLINLHLEQGNVSYAFHRFQQYLGDCAPPCDAAFDRLYNDGLIATRTPPTPLKRRERFYTLVGLLQQTQGIAGLAAECGCFRGLSSYLLCSSLKLADAAFDGRGYRIFDSFAGLSAPQAEDAVTAATAGAADLRQNTQAGKYAAEFATVKANLRAFPGIEYFPGWIPQAFPDEPAARYRFVHIDVDIYQPTRDSLGYFYPKLAPGGIIVCDDYNWPGARKAIDEFCAGAGVTCHTTPQMQAYLLKVA
jgi:O-methyltransferase